MGGQGVFTKRLQSVEEVLMVVMGSATGNECKQGCHTGLNRLCTAHFSDHPLREKRLGARAQPLELRVFCEACNCSVDTAHTVAPNANAVLGLG